ncbi:MAG: DUF2802 domain-containing protein [Methylococcaceae bacterium]
MDNILLIVIIIILVNAGVLVWLILQHKKLRQDFIVLSAVVERNNKDIAGLCSAAVSVDNRVYENKEQLKGIVEKVVDFEQHEQQLSQPYHGAIQRVRNGATAEELIQQCGLSREEATLLIRLHGQSE